MVNNSSGTNTSGNLFSTSIANAVSLAADATGQIIAGSATGIIQTINGDSGSITGSTVTIYSNNTANNSGSSVKFVSSGTTSTLNVTDAKQNTIVGNLAGNGSILGTVNTGLGFGALISLANGANNVDIGAKLTALTDGSNNISVGAGTGNITTGRNNILLGFGSGHGYTSSESSNIVIQNIGTTAGVTVGESNVIRIGVSGSSEGQQNKCFVAGVASVSVSNLNIVTIDTATGQMGSQAAANVGTVTQFDVLVGGAAGAIASVGPGTSGQILQSAGNASNPAYSTATYPATTTINQILYSSSTNVIAGITAANNGTLISGTTGIPSFLANGSTGQILTATTGSPPSWVAPATSGTVTSVSGTANQVSVATGTTTPVISLVGPYTPATYTAHGLLIGETTSSIVAMAAGSAGQIVQSGGASADPVYSTATYPSVATGTGTILRANGTNWVATTATYPTTTTSQQILYSTADSVIGQLTTANSALAATNSSGTLAMRLFSIVTQVFTADGTYTPTSGMLYCVIEAVGGGGGGGSVPLTSSVQVSAAAGGGAGGYSRKTFSAATIGASKTITMGTAGAAGTSGGAGGNGGTTTVGATILSAAGGTGGAAGAAATGVYVVAGGAGGAGSLGDFNTTGNPGLAGLCIFNAAFPSSMSGAGGSSFFGGGGLGVISLNGGQAAGNAGSSSGGGGSGAAASQSGTAQNGGAGVKGIVVVTEYVIA